MILSKTAEYGIRIILQLAVEGGDASYVPARELARRCGIPVHFLGKICHKLTRGGVLSSHKGPGGGVALATPPSQISLLSVIGALDELGPFERCVLGTPFCGDRPCPLHESWAGIKEQILCMLSDRNVEEIAAEIVEGRASLNEAAAVTVAAGSELTEGGT